jgi:hypothetical protein
MIWDERYATHHNELAGLVFKQGLECERDVIEGHLHTGCGAVAQVVARQD